MRRTQGIFPGTQGIILRTKGILNRIPGIKSRTKETAYPNEKTSEKPAIASNSS